jgi:hypothetical protein
VKRGLEGLIAGAVKAELDRLIGRVADPIHAKVDEVITQAARRAAAPLQARLERAVSDAVQRVADGLLKAVWPEKKRP